MEKITRKFVITILLLLLLLTIKWKINT